MALNDVVAEARGDSDHPCIIMLERIVGLSVEYRPEGLMKKCIIEGEIPRRIWFRFPDCGFAGIPKKAHNRFREDDHYDLIHVFVFEDFDEFETKMAKSPSAFRTMDWYAVPDGELVTTPGSDDAEKINLNQFEEMNHFYHDGANVLGSGNHP